MVTNWTKWLVGTALVCLLSGPLSAADNPHATPQLALHATIEGGPAGPNQFWLGVRGAPLEPLLKSHLKLEAGVVVENVIPDSPAAKAGIKEQDILLKFGETKVADPLELSKAVNENKDREAKVTLLREGKETTVTVKPGPRPAQILVETRPDAGDVHKQLQEALKKFEHGQGGENPFQMLFMHPGVLVPEGQKLPTAELKLGIVSQMPNNTSVTVSKSGDGPANIVVKQGDKTWEVKDNELDKLPEDVRKMVQGMLGGGIGVLDWRGEGVRLKVQEQVKKARSEALKAQANAAEAAKKVKAHTEDAQDQVSKNLERLNKQLEQMQRQSKESEQRSRQELDKLRQQLEELKKAK